MYGPLIMRISSMLICPPRESGTIREINFRRGTVINKSLGFAGIFTGGCRTNFHDNVNNVMETTVRCETAQNSVAGNAMYCGMRVRTNEIMPLTMSKGSARQVSVKQRVNGFPPFRLKASLPKNTIPQSASAKSKNRFPHKKREAMIPKNDGMDIAHTKAIMMSSHLNEALTVQSSTPAPQRPQINRIVPMNPMGIPR